MNPISGKRILLLEDEVLLALEATESLEEMGAVVVGPAHCIEAAMALLDTDRPDAALLDVNIAGSSSAAVAERLISENIPFVLATGYGTHAGIIGSLAIIDKPYSRAQLRAAVSRAFAAPSSGPLEGHRDQISHG